MESYQRAYEDAKSVPTDQEFIEGWKNVQEAKEQQIRHCVHALRQFMGARGLHGDPTDALRARSGHAHDRALGKWKIWQGQVHLLPKPEVAKPPLPPMQEIVKPPLLDKSLFRRWAAVLWPVGSTLLALIGMPVAIEQYPELFRQNTWILPICTIVVIACWVAPVLFHESPRRWYRSVASLPRLGAVLAPALTLALLTLLILGSVRLFRYHRNHLVAALRNDDHPSGVTPASGNQPATLSQVPSMPFAATAVPPAETTGIQGERQIELIFKDSPLFTKERRSTIRGDINRLASYLGALGLPIPSDIPPIGVDTKNPKATGWSFNEQRNNKYYYNTFTVQHGALDDRHKTTEAFISFVVGRFIYTPPIPLQIPNLGNQTPQQFYDSTHTPEQMDRSYRWLASVPLTQYLNHSYWNQPFAKNQQPVCPDQGDGTAFYFWKMRSRFGKEFTDKLAVFTLRAAVDKPYSDSTQSYRQYLYERLKMADSVIDNENAKLPEIEAIYRNCGWSPN
jgi:hypothetical protein